ncbi:SRPBCC family protein [Saccharothrix sp. S26]|uniref:type II toxin-antitoxin system RatA family toxin n=1 Tax=Saccharothrix sp. S26 TaxID=2907215 RepID=UPI001F3B1132|nr:SRPBCC family protein [Saccharothrix sp. S26]MCE6998374.1 SRPBCC family protein [Saccharothrix sp. S26]
MRHVEVHAFIRGVDAGTVFDTLADFRHYAELVDIVRSVDMETSPDGTTVSHWVVEFRNGLLQWTERDWFRRDELRLDFDQTDGDFDEFSGGWVLDPTPEGVRTAFITDFDFGVPSLASIVEPVAERVLSDVIQLILIGLFGDAAEFPQGAVVPERQAAAVSA